MAPLEAREAATGQLSTTALAAILTGVGIVILGLLIGLVVLLVRAIRTHKRLLADLEDRGVNIAQSREDAQQDQVARPCTVLRRNTILPFNKKSGWGALPSIETINSPEPPSIPPHYAPPKPEGFVSKSNRLSWPFSARRASGKAVHMRKIKVPTLSTVVESPKPSPLVPVLKSALSSEPPSPKKNGSQSRPSSDQSLLKYHPAFRSQGQAEPKVSGDMRPDVLCRSMTAKPAPKTDTRNRPNRSKSVAEIPISTKYEELSQAQRSSLHARSASMCSQSSGNAPNAILPPLPLEVARLKNEARRRSGLRRSPSHVSVSNHESANSSILATQSSLILSGPSNMRVQKVTKRHWRNSMISGPRPIRDTLVLHGKNQASQGSIRSSVARFSSVESSSQTEPQDRDSVSRNSSSPQSTSKVNTASSISVSKLSSPSGSPLAVRNFNTPKRKSGSYVTPFGSPEERRKRLSVPQNVSGNNGAIQRQISQASTRSSNGNPFQWDPTPLSSGKPSALKGSPGARKGHRRQNCVRIALSPTILGPASGSSSPSNLTNVQEQSPNVSSEQDPKIGLGFSNTRSLPQPPRSSTFAPEVKINTAPIKASLTQNSPTLSMVDYDHGAAGSPVLTQILPELSAREIHRLSTGSVFSIPSFPSPCRGVRSVDSFASSPPPVFALSTPSKQKRGDFIHGDPSSPFDVSPDVPSFPYRSSSLDTYDPEHPQLIFETPTNSPTKGYSTPFFAIPEESSAQSTRTANNGRLRLEDSPPCSPKTIPPAYNLPIKDTMIPEDADDHTIDPTILIKDAFSALSSSFRNFDTINGNIMKTLNTSHNSIPISNNTTSATSTFEPLLQAAFPSSPSLHSRYASSTNECLRSDSVSGPDLPIITVQTSPSSSRYSSPSPKSSPSPLPIPPCSPRPQHAQLPPPSLNFTAMPTLSPSLCGPRGSPPWPLRSSIQKLRRMNSDAEKRGRCERRYLRLGREESICLAGDESWLEELKNIDELDETWDEEKGRRLVGNILKGWEEEQMFESREAHVLPNSSVNGRLSNEDTVGGHEERSEYIDDTNNKDPDGLSGTSSPSQSPEADRNKTLNTGNRSSSIWEDGEKFWHSTPPHPISAAKSDQRSEPAGSSPLGRSKQGRKRDFDVARDDSPLQPLQEDLVSTGNEEKRNEQRRKRDSLSSYRYRKRSVLGVGTPNARVTVQVQPPSSSSLHGTPASLYDQEGFLRL